nr:F49 [uncultured bacterium]
MAKTGDAKESNVIWVSGVANIDQIAMEDIDRGEEAFLLVERLLSVLDLDSGAVELHMTLNDYDGTSWEVGHAIRHLYSLHETWSIRNDDDDIKPPDVASLELLLAVMRFSQARGTKNAADAEFKLASHELRRLEVETGMIDPNNCIMQRTN